MTSDFGLKAIRKNRVPLIAIAAIAASAATVFAWAAGLVGTRTTSKTFFGDTLNTFAAGYRRAHGKGACFEGTFRSSGAAAPLSSARFFAPGEFPALGRFSLGSASPYAADSSAGTVGMALLLTTDDSSQWRMKMNNIPYFATHNFEGFLAQAAAFKPDKATGKPDPQRVEAFFKDYPEARKSVAYRANAPRPASFAGAEYNAVHAYILVAANGDRQAVRWIMRPHAPFTSISAEQRAQASPDFLFEDLAQRLKSGPLYWDLVLQLAEPGDPVDDPSQPWPESRKRTMAGTLEVKRVVDQVHGACRDVNFDPTLVPPGMALSNDPVLAARAAIYAQSYNARLGEIGFGRATDAVGKQEKK